MGSKRRCVLCSRKESRWVPFVAHPDGIGPVCENTRACEQARRPILAEPQRHPGGMTYEQAFFWLRGRVDQLQKIPIGGCTRAEREEEQALCIALSAMKDFSGCFPPEEMIDASELPTPRED